MYLSVWPRVNECVSTCLRVCAYVGHSVSVSLSPSVSVPELNPVGIISDYVCRLFLAAPIT